jgi:hypothetical protein
MVDECVALDCIAAWELFTDEGGTLVWRWRDTRFRYHTNYLLGHRANRIKLSAKFSTSNKLPILTFTVPGQWLQLISAVVQIPGI